MMGVGYDLFWTLNPKSLQPFVEAFTLKQKYDNVNNWQLGLYIQVAIASVLDKKTNYPKTPFGEEVVEKKLDTKVFREIMLAKMTEINKSIKKGG